MSLLYTAINLTLGSYLQVEFLYYISGTPISLYLEWIYIYIWLQYVFCLLENSILRRIVIQILEYKRVSGFLTLTHLFLEKCSHVLWNHLPSCPLEWIQMNNQCMFNKTAWYTKQWMANERTQHSVSCDCIVSDSQAAVQSELKSLK